MVELSNSFFIVQRQQRAWAERRSMSFDSRERVVSVEDNLFQALHVETEKEFQDGDGVELGDKMRALYSSAALVCNVFDYWRDKPHQLAPCLGMSACASLCVCFEKKLPIFGVTSRNDASQRRRAPNIDVLIDGGLVAPYNLGIEGKLTEPYVRYPSSRPPFTPTYFGPDAHRVWTDLPQTKALAEDLKGQGEKFTRLDAPQLIKSALGLQRRFGHGTWRLVYLWYDVVVQGDRTEESSELAADLQRFSDRVKAEIQFEAITWQELFLRIRSYSGDEDRHYVDYLAGRYFGGGA
jgi:hypothetical protein